MPTIHVSPSTVVPAKVSAAVSFVS